jgi:DNA-binding transcriptional ArsR family regulator
MAREVKPGEDHRQPDAAADGEHQEGQLDLPRQVPATRPGPVPSFDQLFLCSLSVVAVVGPDIRKDRSMPAKSKNGRDVPAPLLHALNHSIRRRVLRLMDERGRDGRLSPVEAAALLDISLTTVAYHFRVLVATNAIVEVGRRQVRGTIQHFFQIGDSVREATWVEGVLRDTARTD